METRAAVERRTTWTAGAAPAAGTQPSSGQQEFLRSSLASALALLIIVSVRILLACWNIHAVSEGAELAGRAVTGLHNVM